MGLSHKNYYYSMRLKKGLNGVFLEWLYTTAAMFTPFLIVPVSLFLIDFLRPIESVNCCLLVQIICNGRIEW